MTSHSSTYHLSIINNTHITSAHSIIMTIILLIDEYHFSMPLVFPQILTHVFLTLTSRMKANNCDKVIKWRGFSRQTSRCRVFQKEFFHTLTRILTREFSFDFLVSWGKENNSCFIINSLFLPPRVSYVDDAFL